MKRNRTKLSLLAIILMLLPIEAKPAFALDWIKKALLNCTQILPTCCNFKKIGVDATQNPTYHYHTGNLANDTVTIFVPGYENTYEQVYYYVSDISGPYHDSDNQLALITTDFVTFDFADTGLERFRFNRKESSMGQENEIERLRSIIEDIQAKNPGKEFILYGLSRGASTILNLLAQYPNYPIKALVLESPFGHLKDVINHIITLAGLGNVPGTYTAGMLLAKCLFPKFKMSGPHPIDHIPEIPSRIPILVICSEEDRLVPCSSSLNIFKKLCLSGHSNSHLLLLNNGKHAALFKPDGHKYQDGVHAFYQLYQLPHDQTFAKRGAQYLVSCSST